MSSSARISPTAHYTSQVWVDSGWSPQALGTRRGRLAHRALAPFEHLAAPWVGGNTLTRLLRARHQAVDRLLEDELAGGARQVVEIAAGLSGRGLRFTARYPDVRFIEGDLPGMVAEKLARLREVGVRAPNHEVRHIDFLADDGPNSIPGLFASALDPGLPTVVITEGLLNYLDRASVERAWARIARVLRGGAGGTYLTDVHLRDEVERFVPARLFLRGLSVFARGAVELHHADWDEFEGALRDAGFDELEAPDARAWIGAPSDGPTLLRVLRARVRPAAAAATSG